MCCPVFSPKDLGLGRLGGGQVIKSWKLWTLMELALGAPLRKRRLWTVVAQLQDALRLWKKAFFEWFITNWYYLTHILTFIVDLPINSMVIFHSSCLPEAIWHSIWHLTPALEIRQCPCWALALAKSRGPHLAGDVGKNLCAGVYKGCPYSSLFNMIPKTVSFSVPWPNSPPCCFLYQTSPECKLNHWECICSEILQGVLPDIE